ncbi:hypothetical protein M5689_023836 [Euphorbia peplus]|nr:hypothetical protein M5689_023836 [Euphorbia peplus]
MINILLCLGFNFVLMQLIVLHQALNLLHFLIGIKFRVLIYVFPHVYDLKLKREAGIVELFRRRENKVHSLGHVEISSPTSYHRLQLISIGGKILREWIETNTDRASKENPSFAADAEV